MKPMLNEPSSAANRLSPLQVRFDIPSLGSKSTNLKTASLFLCTSLLLIFLGILSNDRKKICLNEAKDNADVALFTPPSLRPNPSVVPQTRIDTEIMDYIAKVQALIDVNEPYEIAKKVFQRSGCYPLSFALPSSRFEIIEFEDDPFSALNPFHLERMRKQKERDMAFIYPGREETYIYSNELDYRNGYLTSWKATTFKKAGWDCNRHIEILSAGAIPIFHNVKEIPYGTMTLYPKKLLKFMEDNQRETDIRKLSILRYFGLNWARKFLTFANAVRYMANLTKIDLSAPGVRVAYIDDSIPNTADYLSSVVLGGLGEILDDENVDGFFEAPYLRMNGPWHTGRNQKIYGRGFGNSHYLPPKKNQRTQAEMLQDLRRSKYTVVAYGCFTRTRAYHNELAALYKPNQVWIPYCNDDPTNVNFRAYPYGTNFVRELVGW